MSQSDLIVVDCGVPPDEGVWCPGVTAATDYQAACHVFSPEAGGQIDTFARYVRTLPEELERVRESSASGETVILAQTAAYDVLAVFYRGNWLAVRRSEVAGGKVSGQHPAKGPGGCCLLVYLPESICLMNASEGEYTEWFTEAGRRIEAALGIPFVFDCDSYDC